jgi:hypothetical protein
MSHASTIIQVNCLDGPCRGIQHIDLDTGRILFHNTGDPQWHIYQVSDPTTITHIGHSRYPSAYYDHTEPATPRQ